MIENVSTQLTVFHCFAHCLLPGRAFASFYALLFLEKEAEIGGREYTGIVFCQIFIQMKWRGDLFPLTLIYRKNMQWIGFEFELAL